MTCIVGIAQNGQIVMGGDSAGVAGLDLTIRADPKVFSIGDFTVGYTDSFRFGQLLRFSFVPPSKREDQSDFEYMCTSFIDALRNCLKDGGYARKEGEAETGGTCLVGWRGMLYEIESDYQVGIPINGYDAIGCGAPMARGSLFSTEGQPLRDRVQMALEAAVEFSAGVRPPFLILESTTKES